MWSVPVDELARDQKIIHELARDEEIMAIRSDARAKVIASIEGGIHEARKLLKVAKDEHRKALSDWLEETKIADQKAFAEGRLSALKVYEDATLDGKIPYGQEQRFLDFLEMSRNAGQKVFEVIRRERAANAERHAKKMLREAKIARESAVELLASNTYLKIPSVIYGQLSFPEAADEAIDRKGHSCFSVAVQILGDAVNAQAFEAERQLMALFEEFEITGKKDLEEYRAASSKADLIRWIQVIAGIITTVTLVYALMTIK
jgi:hypothetical protein